MATKHTPGPWHSHAKDTRRNHAHEVHTFHVANGLTEHFVVANTATHEAITTERSEANAYLIAASPSLLEAAKNLCDDFGDNKSYDSYRSNLVDELRTALGKAEPPPSGKE